ncbi:MAG: OmpA family protein [Methylomonas sp.]|jgi:outer membrane protein OmpA-like peptidoglycan-associated protein|uniref:OmpA family protein n=1 Tax=Methylomonas sp. TaxID=418 RepID=UPI0025CE30BD|nr:OmpA family protein [Methylomonas sp.]MCK9605100.1 OmpA family protein [Methylomonas sp.]
MKTHSSFQFSLYSMFAAAIVSGCSSMPQNAALTDAHNSYNNARINSKAATLAALEMKQAADTLDKADQALNDDEDTEMVDHLAYMARQQVAIALAAATQKSAEIDISQASAQRNEVRLEARTAEVDAAHRQTANDQALIAKQEVLINQLNAKQTARGLVITLGDVLFRTNRAQLESGGLRDIDKLADFLKQYPTYKVLVEGYTDSRGSDDLNQELSDRRAYAVRTALVDAGVGSAQVTTRGYGEAYPVAGNDTSANRRLNRRVEIVLSDETGNIATR